MSDDDAEGVEVFFKVLLCQFQANVSGIPDVTFCLFLPSLYYVCSLDHFGSGFLSNV